VGPDAAHETGVDALPSEGRRSAGLTERLAAASARRARRVLAIWGIAVVAALILVGTSLSGLTTGAHVVGTTQSSRAETLYRQALGASAGQRPTDVIVVSSKRSTVSDGSFQQFVARLAAQVRTAPGVTHVATDLSAGSQFVSSDHHAALIALRAATDADIKPVVGDVQAANGSGGFSVAVTGDHTVGNDFTTLSASELQHGELDFGLPISIVILLLVFGAVVAGLMPVLMALLSIIVGLGIAALLAREFSLSVFIVNMMTGMGLALGIDYSLFMISRFREERGQGRGKEAAIRLTGATASRAVLFSGSTFVVALLGMFLVPVTILRSLAAGAVMLSLIGDRVNSLRLPIVGKNLGRSDTAEARIWRAVTGRVMRRPAVSLALAGGFMLLAAVPVLGLHIGQSGVTSSPARTWRLY
jgi:RND superfamily putative drug exporter